MSNVITFNNVWKKYSRQQVLNNSLREEIVSVITGKKCREELAEGEFWALQDIINVLVKKKSSGMYLRFVFSIAVQSPADIYLIDELLVVGVEAFQQRCAERLQQLPAGKKTILIVSHDAGKLQRTCDRICRLEHGSLQQGSSFP